MIHQLRIYQVADTSDATRDAFYVRMGEQSFPIMDKLGFEVVGRWESRTDDGLEFVYILQWADQAAMDAGWEAFHREWATVPPASTADGGPLVTAVENRILESIAELS